ncbi:MAG: acetolactate synthase large subunit [Syntrophobacter sp.]
MSKLSGAQIIVELLERQGIRTIAGIPGGGNLPLYDALSRSGRIHHVLARHEQGAGFIAQGMARVTGLPQACIATSGPGVTNILTAIADAKLDSIPVVCIAGQVPRPLIGTSAFQEVDTYRLSLPITKKSFEAGSASALLDIVPEAFRVAASGRPGPVLIDVPKDVQTEMVDVDVWPEPGKPDRPPAFPAEDVLLAVEVINAAKRPVLFLGGGVIHSEAGRLAVQLAEKASIPVATSLMGLGAIPSDHPLCLGLIGMHAAVYTNMVLDECDLLISAGVRFDDRATGKVAEFCPRAEVIHIDIDPGEIGKLKTAHIGIAGDIGEVLEMMLPAVENSTRGKWLSFVDGLRREHPQPMPSDGDLGVPYGLIRETARLLGDEAIITTDVGQHQMWTAQAYPFRGPRQWLTSGGLGTMGFGVPAAIGAALSSPGRPVVCFSGDGSLMMNIQELATAVQEAVDVKIVVFDNSCLGLVRQQQDLFFERRIFACNFDSPADFVRIAEGFGMRAFDLDASDDPLGTLAHALKTKGPCLIRARIGRDEKVYPMVPPGAPNRCMLDGI